MILLCEIFKTCNDAIEPMEEGISWRRLYDIFRD